MQRTVRSPVERVELLTALNSAAATLQTAATSEEAVFETVHTEIQRLGLRGGVSLLDESGEVLSVRVASYPGADGLLGDIQRLLGKNVVGHRFPVSSVDVYREVLESGNAVFVSDTTDTIRQLMPTGTGIVAKRVLAYFGSTPGIYAPVRGQNRLLGVLNLAGRGLAADDRPAMQAFANHVAIALDNARLLVRLKESEARYRSLVEQAGDGIFLSDATGKFFEVNPAGLAMLGYTAEELFASTVGDVIAPGDMEAQPLRLDDLDTGQIVLIERELRRKDGSLVPVEICARQTEPGVILGIVRDISERRRAQKEQRELYDQLQQAQKLEALGTLAGGLAHDINNVLTVVLGLASYLDVATDDPERVRELVAQIARAARRGSALTHGLLEFCRGGQGEKETAPVREIVADVANILQRTLPKLIRLELQIADNVGAMHGSPNQLSQALMNLCVNAADAIGGQGKIIVSAQAVDIEATSSPHPDLSEGPHTRLQVIDNGVGMDARQRRRAFDPFFTTKDVGKGTGLGLSMVYRAVNNHGGAVRLDSEPGKGTTVSLWIPTQAVPAPRTTVEDARLFPRGEGTVLLIDDEEIVRDVGERLVAHLGYQVLTATDGASGLDVYAAHTDAISVILLDLAMPGMNGLECLHRLREAGCTVPIVLCTGHGVELDDPAYEAASDLLRKPFAIDELSRKLHRVLGSASASSAREAE